MSKHPTITIPVAEDFEPVYRIEGDLVIAAATLDQWGRPQPTIESTDGISKWDMFYEDELDLSEEEVFEFADEWLHKNREFVLSLPEWKEAAAQLLRMQVIEPEPESEVVKARQALYYLTLAATEGFRQYTRESSDKFQRVVLDALDGSKPPEPTDAELLAGA